MRFGVSRDLVLVRAYLRASADELLASRAQDQLEAFVAERGLKIAALYIEHEGGAELARPELFRLLSDSRPGDILLIEQVNCLSRLMATDWQRLRTEISQRQLRIVALDLPTSWTLTVPGDDFTGWILMAMTGMLLDTLAAVARKDDDSARAE